MLMFLQGCRGEPCCMAGAHHPYLLCPGILGGVRTCSPGQQLLCLLNKVATEPLKAFLFFFFLLHFIEMIRVRCETFLKVWREQLSGFFCLVSLSLQGVTLQRRPEEAAAAVTCSWWSFMGSEVSTSCETTMNYCIWSHPLAFFPQSRRKDELC